GTPQPEVHQPDGSSGALEVAPIDPTTLTGTPDERLAALEAAVDRAASTAAESGRRIKARYVIEAGTALRAIRDGELYPGTWEEYVTTRHDLSLRRSYQLMEAAPALQRVWTCKILHTPPNESQALAIDPVIETHGEDAARKIVKAIEEAGRRPTAAALKATARELGYTAPEEPRRAPQETPESSPRPTTEADSLADLEEATRLLRRVHRALHPKTLEAARATNPDRATEVISEISDVLAKAARRAQRG
ncbi:hypothetical protein, partial [Streptomyces alkaliphilus]|uniref:hypothetical protein n=1 Tax=Streptomyces alkaliphilus TaxID=1472722 RepID=UPI00225E6F3A